MVLCLFRVYHLPFYFEFDADISAQLIYFLRERCFFATYCSFPLLFCVAKILKYEILLTLTLCLMLAYVYCWRTGLFRHVTVSLCCLLHQTVCPPFSYSSSSSSSCLQCILNYSVPIGLWNSKSSVSESGVLRRLCIRVLLVFWWWPDSVRFARGANFGLWFCDWIDRLTCASFRLVQYVCRQYCDLWSNSASSSSTFAKFLHYFVPRSFETLVLFKLWTLVCSSFARVTRPAAEHCPENSELLRPDVSCVWEAV